MKGRILATLCAVALLVGVFCMPGAASQNVCFTAVNDSLLELQANAMPVWVNGLLYVPGTVFDRTVTKVDFGMQYNYSSSSNTVTLYNLRQMLVFDLAKGNSYDQISGRVMSAKAVNRNGKIYLPVVAVCDFFDLQHSYTQTPSGYLLRIRNHAAWLSDKTFQDAASTEMANQRQKYQDSLKPVDPPAPPTPSVQPVDPPDDMPQVENPQVQTQVCIGVRCTTGEGLQTILDGLDRAGWRGVFFFDPDIIAGQDALVRRVVASGHTVGLLADGEDAQGSREQLDRGNRLLALTACTAATAVFAPQEQRQELERDHWVCWRDTQNGAVRTSERANIYVQRMVNGLGTGRRTVYLTLDDSAATARVIGTLLTQLKEEGYAMLAPIETRM